MKRVSKNHAVLAAGAAGADLTAIEIGSAGGADREAAAGAAAAGTTGSAAGSDIAKSRISK